MSSRLEARLTMQPAAMPELTILAVAIGLGIGVLVAASNMFFGLQTGFISMMSLQSALIGYLVSRMLPTPLTPQQIIVVQTTAVATGTMPLAAGFVGILPALGLLNEKQDGIPPIHLSFIPAVGWSLAVAFFGVFLSPPIRKQVIIDEQLPFPSGTATAHLIAALHQLPPPSSEANLRHRVGYTNIDDSAEQAPRLESDSNDEDDEEAVRESAVVRQDGWHSLLWSFSASALLTLTAYFFPVVFSIPIFGTYLASQWLWTFTPSLSYVGQGIIMGLPTTLSMNLGMIAGWGILSPLSKLQGWAPGPVGNMTNGARGWILWTSLAIMCADSLVSLFPVVLRTLKDVLLSLARREFLIRDDKEIETEDRLVPMKWVLIGWSVSVFVGIILVWIVFGAEGITPWASFLGYVAGGLLSVLAVRALGETDINPVSGLGKISQLFFAYVQPGNVVANLLAGGIAEAGAQQAGDLMQDLKTGHLCGASPRAQFYGQLIGSGLSILVSAAIYGLYRQVYEIPGPQFPAPTAYIWLGLARLLRDGQLPDKSSDFMIVSAVIFGLISAFRIYAVRRQLWYVKWIPSGVAFAIGFLNTPSFSIARLIGGIIEYLYRTRYARDRNDIRLIVVASGFVLGEGVTSVISLLLRTWGVGAISCGGCSHGLCGGGCS